MKNVALVGDRHECSLHRLPDNRIISSPCRSTCEGRQIAVVGAITSCGAVIIEGSGHWNIEGRDVATLGSKTLHAECGAAGVIVTATAKMVISGA